MSMQIFDRTNHQFEDIPRTIKFGLSIGKCDGKTTDFSLLFIES